jgi:GT2 family glycosyltransferase
VVTPKVLISLLNWNNFTSTSRTIDSIKLLSYIDYELIIIDNCSTDHSIDKIHEHYPEFKVLKNKTNLGYAGGHKKALDYLYKIKFDLMWIINNDIIVNDNTLSELVESYKKNGEGLYGSLILDQSFIIQFSGGNELKNDFIDFYKSNIYFGKQYHDVVNQLEEKKVGILHGASFMIPVSIIKKYGFIKTSFFLYGEEVDYCLRLLKKGIYCFFVPTSTVIHYESETVNLNEKLSIVGSYYKKRNSLYYNFNFKFPNSNKLQIIRNHGGLIKICRIIITHYQKKIRLHKNNVNNEKEFYESLALFHFIFGIKGKTLNPDQCINI